MSIGRDLTCTLSSTDAEAPDSQAQNAAPSLLFRSATIDDAVDIYALVAETGVLELNSAYAYVLLCTHFSDTCLVACQGERLVGFVAAYFPPELSRTEPPNRIFVWQIGVSPSQQGKGIGKALLANLLKQPVCQNAHYLEATVGVSNKTSQALFNAFIKTRQCAFEIVPWLLPEHFPLNADKSEHEAEMLYRIDLSKITSGN